MSPTIDLCNYTDCWTYFKDLHIYFKESTEKGKFTKSKNRPLTTISLHWEDGTVYSLQAVCVYTDLHTAFLSFHMTYVLSK